MGVSGQRHAPAALAPRKRPPCTHCTVGCVGLRAGLDTEVTGKILRPCRGSNSDRPVRSQTLYCLSYQAPTVSNLSHEEGAATQKTTLDNEYYVDLRLINYRMGVKFGSWRRTAYIRTQFVFNFFVC
jgi:hypothetical protein